MAARVRTHDWGATPLGPIEDWSLELKAATMLVLDTGFAAALTWGGTLTTIYNDAFIAILGSKPDGLGRSFAEIWAEAWDEVEPIAARAYAGEASFIADFPLLVDRGGGPERAFFTFSYSPLRRADGSVVGMIDIVTETTPEVEARLALRENELRFRAFVTASSDAVYRMNPDWTEMRQLAGRNFLPDTITPSGTWLDRYIHPEDQQIVRSAIAEAISAKSIFELAHRVIRADGSDGWTLSRAVPILSDDGDISEWLGTASDITAAEQAVAAQEEAEAARQKRERERAFLLGFTDALKPITGPGDAADAACRLLAEHLDAGCVQFATVEGLTGTEIGEVRGEHVRRGGLLPHSFALAPFGNPVLATLREGQPFVLADAGSDARLGDVERLAFRAAAASAAIFIPLLRGGSLSAMLTVNDPNPRGWASNEIELTQAVAERTWIAFDRNRAEAALGASEERLRQFGEASQDVLWSRDAETLQWDYLTPAFETTYGLDRASALRGDNLANWVAMIVPEDRERAMVNLQRVRGGEWVTFEYRVCRPSDGRIRWIRDTDFPIRDEAGTVVRIAGIGHDVTALKATEEALAAAEERQRVLLEGIPQLVWRAADVGKWTWASPQWTEYTGQAEEDSHSSGWLKPLHPDDRDKARKAWAMAEASGGFEVDCRIYHASVGEYRWFTTRAAPVHDNDGAIVEWLGTSTDVDELRRLQEMQRTLLAELQHRVRNILAVIRSMMRRSSDGQHSLSDYVQHLEGRLGALARTQVLLTRAVDARIDIEELIRDELLAQAVIDDRITVCGPKVSLGAKAAEIVTLAIHELATNAIKYGALARNLGSIDVRWHVEDKDETPWFYLTWIESGVTVAVFPSSHEGFGTELITQRVPYELKGRGELKMTAGGVQCKLEFPLRDRASILQSNAAYHAR